MKNKFITLTITFTIFYGFNANALSLKDAINESLVNNLSLKAESSNVSIAEEDYFQSKADFFPTITLSGNIAESEYTDITSQSGTSSAGYELSPSSKSVILSQNIFSGFNKIFSARSTKGSLAATKLNQEKIKQDIILETIEAYYNVILAQKTVNSYEDNLKSVEEQFKATTKEYEVGLSSKTDVAQSEAFYNNAKISLLESQIIEKNLRDSFSDLTGVKADDLKFSEIETALPTTLGEYRDVVNSNNYAIRLARANLDISNANIGIARSAYLPQVSLTATKSELDEYSSTVDSLTNEEIKATVTWPIFNSGKSLSNVRKAKKARNLQMIQLQRIQNEIITLSSNIWQKHLISERTIKAAELTYEANKIAYRGTEIEQEVGERSVLDVLTARKALLNSEIAYFTKQKDREVTKTQVLYMAGSLNVDTLGL